MSDHHSHGGANNEAANKERIMILERDMRSAEAADRDLRDTLREVTINTQAALRSLNTIENQQRIEFDKLSKRVDFIESVLKKLLEPKEPTKKPTKRRRK